MATIKEVARRARVSVGTVSNVLTGTVQVSPKLAERVRAAIRELDYHPDHVARSLKIRQTKMLGMVISDITNPFFPQVVRGAEDAALKHGYLLVTFNTDDHVEREKDVLSVLRARRVDGILLVVSPSRGDVEHIQKTIQSGVRVVCLDRIPPGIAVDGVSVDNVKGANVCVRHLLSMGHRKIAIITGSLDLQTARDRLEGYRQALREARVPVDKQWIREGDFRAESGFRLGKDLMLSRQRPTALFVSNGMMCLGVLRALDETGLRCPQDLALASFDDIPLADVFHPHLTAVAQPAYEIGNRGVDLLIQRIQESGPIRKPVLLLLEPELKIRESTMSGQPPARNR